MAAGHPTRHCGTPPAAFEVWRVDPRRCGAELRDLEAREPRLPDELAEAAAKHPDRAASHIALRVLLERALGTRIGRSPYVRTAHGKPSLANVPLAFSLSHCAGMTLVAIAEKGPIGVDIEPADRGLDTLLTRAGRIEAAATVLASHRALPGTDERRTLAAWVRIEAFAKADGMGVGVLLSRLGIIGARIAETDVAARAEALKRHEPLLEVDDIAVPGGFVAAVARPAGAAAPLMQDFPATLAGIRALIG